jgi:VanZ family protein
LLASVIVGLLVGTAIETCQYFLPVPRSVQLSDVILNTLSVVIGSVICRVFLLFRAKRYGNGN